VAGSFALAWLMERKQPGKICRQGHFRRRAGLPREPAPLDLLKYINWLRARSSVAPISHS
jgi:hypothetical protein